MTARVRLADLDAATAAKVRAKIAAQDRTVAPHDAARAREASTATGRARGRAPRWRCHTCGETFTAWAPAGSSDHTRLEVLLETVR